MNLDETRQMTATEFVTERLYEDEMMARAAGVGTWAAGERCVWRVSTIAEVDIVTDGLDGEGGTESPEIADHIARHDPARVLAQCAAMRKIVEGMQPYGPIDDMFAPEILGIFAAIWSDHPDWREEWR